MTLLEQMITKSPLRLELNPDQRAPGYRCTWSVLKDGAWHHAVGISNTAGGAVYQAWKEAQDKGWTS